MTHRRLFLISAAYLWIALGCLCGSMLPADLSDARLDPPPPLLEPSFTPRPISTPAPTATTGGGVLESIASATVPNRDRYDLAARFLGVRGVPTQIALPRLPQTGDVQRFFVDNDDAGGVVEVDARLWYAGEHVALWFEEGVDVNPTAAQAVGEAFDERIYPTNHAAFGSEPNPGIDGDPRVHVLNTTQLGMGLAGYFFSPSLYPIEIVPYSNEKEMIFLNSDFVSPESQDYYLSVLAHEFQHMIHNNVDQNEEAWVNEGLSEVAATLNTGALSDFIPALLNEPETQLTAWPENASSAPHYAAGYLFHMYYLDRFGEDALRALVANPQNGLQAVDAALRDLGAGVDADQVFADWTLANLLNDPSLADGQYAYQSLPNLGDFRVAEQFTRYPVSRNLQANQYGTQYFELRGPSRLTIRFQGGQQVRVIPTSVIDTDGDPATADSLVWWSNRVDESDTTLTREIDLTSVSQAQLDFDLWYLIEDGWDYGYIEVSTDGGQLWTVLRSQASVDYDPHGNAYGPGYTGSSADKPGADADGWIHQSVDLSAYAGQKVLIRFEHISDDATIQPGMTIDNVCVAAIGFCDNMEGGANGWDARGFVRHDNLLPQRYLIQIVLPADNGATAIAPFALDSSNAGEMTVEIGSRPAILAISGLTRFTTESTPYHLEIVEAP